MIYILTFVAVALVPLTLAGYGGHLAGIALPDPRQRKKALLIVWGLAILGVLLFGVTECLTYRADKARDDRDNTAETSRQQFQKNVLGKLKSIEDEPDQKKRKQAASQLVAKLSSSHTPRTIAPKPETQITAPSSSDLALEKAIAAVRNCNQLGTDFHQRLQVAQEKIQRHNSIPNATEVSKREFSAWAMGIANNEYMKQYNQIYKESFIEAIRGLVLAGAQEAMPDEDYENPISMGGVTGVCSDLSETTEKYINQQYTAGKISLVDDQHYLNLIRQTPRPQQK